MLDRAPRPGLVEDTFVKLWRNAERYDRTRGKLETWVLLMARSLAIDAIRRRVLEVRSLELVELPREADEGPGPDDVVVTLDLTARAKVAMASPTPEQRAALELAYLGGKTSARSPTSKASRSGRRNEDPRALLQAARLDGARVR